MSSIHKKTDSGIDIKTVYNASDIAAKKEAIENAQPGHFPYTRGVQPDMYRGKLWTMRQYAGFSTAEESNKRYHYLLSQGVMGLSVAFDLPTQIGYDSDHELADGEKSRYPPVSPMRMLRAAPVPEARVKISMTLDDQPKLRRSVLVVWSAVL